MHYMYGTVSLPKDLLEVIGQLIQNSNLGYRTKTEFIVEAVRDKILGLSKKEASN